MPTTFQKHPMLAMIPFVGLALAFFGGIADGDVLR